VVRGRPSPREIGALGEQTAQRHLRSLGWRILGRNVLTSAGEVDLVALDAGELVCVEVKTARMAHGVRHQPTQFRPGRHFDARRLGRQQRASAELARQLGRASTVRGEGRVDLLEVVLDRETGRAECLHHRNMGSTFRVRG